MAIQFEHLEQLASNIGNLTSNDLERLGRLLVRRASPEACDLLDSIQGEFALIEKELQL